MKKRKRLAGILVLFLVFSFLLPTSSRVYAEDTLSDERLTEEENAEILEDGTVLDGEVNISEDETVPDIRENTDAGAIIEENVGENAGETTEESTVESPEISGETALFAYMDRRAPENSRYSVKRDYGYGRYEDALDVIDNQTGEKIVVYCYNANKLTFDTKAVAVIRIPNASQEEFLSRAGKPRNPTSQLRQKALEVCFKGFPRNGTGIKEKYGLANDEFRMLTQAAVWYYADSLRWDEIIFSNYYRDLWNENTKAAYWEIIQTPVTLPSDYLLDIYESPGSEMQDLLSTNLPADYVPQEEMPKISKTVTKQWIDQGFEQERPQSVQVQLYADGVEYGDPVSLNEQNGWQYTWNDLPKQKEGGDIQYTIREEEVPGYHSLVEEVEGGDFRIQNSKLIDIVLSKVVTGNGGNKNKQFQFEVSLKYADKIALPLHSETIKIIPGVKPGYENECTAPEAASWKYDDKNGIVSGTLSHGQQVTIKGVLLNSEMYYSIKEREANTDGYTTTYNGNENSPSGKALQNIEVEVVNHKEYELPPETGISGHMDHAGVLIGLAVIGLLTAALFYTLRLCKGIKR